MVPNVPALQFPRAAFGKRADGDVADFVGAAVSMSATTIVLVAASTLERARFTVRIGDRSDQFAAESRALIDADLSRITVWNDEIACAVYAHAVNRFGGNFADRSLVARIGIAIAEDVGAVNSRRRFRPWVLRRRPWVAPALPSWRNDASNPVPRLWALTVIPVLRRCRRRSRRPVRKGTL